MKAVVMAGGEGSRLRPLTSNMPKPLVPVAGRPIMEHILLHLRRHQLRDVVATVQYLGASIRNYFGDGSEQGVALSYSVEDSPLGTAGSVMLARQQLNEPFVVISGDSLTDIDLGAAARFHRERKAIATIVLKPVPNPLEYGVVVVDEGGAVQRFIEKPSWGEVISDLANTGIYILDPSVFDFFRPGEVTDWSGDVFPKLLKEGEHVFGWIADGYWEDVGSHSAYMKANFDCLEGRVKVQLPGDRVGDSTWIHPDAEVFPGARVDGPALIGAGAKIRNGAWVNGPAVIGAYTTVDSGVKISNSIVWDHSYIGLNSRLRGAVVCRSVTVKNGCLLEEGSVIGSEVTIGSGSTVNANVRIWPNKDVEAGAVVLEARTFQLVRPHRADQHRDHARVRLTFGSRDRRADAQGNRDRVLARLHALGANDRAGADVGDHLVRQQRDRSLGAAGAGVAVLVPSQPRVRGARPDVAGRPSLGGRADIRRPRP